MNHLIIQRLSNEVMALYGQYMRKSRTPPRSAFKRAKSTWFFLVLHFSGGCSPTPPLHLESAVQDASVIIEYVRNGTDVAVMPARPAVEEAREQSGMFQYRSTRRRS